MALIRYTIMKLITIQNLDVRLKFSLCLKTNLHEVFTLAIVVPYLPLLSCDSLVTCLCIPMSGGW